MVTKSKTNGNTEAERRFIGLMIVHIIYSRSPSLKQFFLLTVSYRSLSIKQSTSRKHSNTNTEQAVPHRHIVDAALLSLVKAI